MHTYLMLNRGILSGYQMTNAVLKVKPIKKDETNNPLFREGFFEKERKPWEVRYDNGYPNIIYDEREKIYRCYYTLFTKDQSSASTPLEERRDHVYSPSSRRITSLCYAESRDGIHFDKPNLGLVEFQGNRNNNILMDYAHGTGVFLDPEEKDPKKRYKLVTKIEYNELKNYMAVGFSEDGIHFGDLIPWPEFNPAADCHNFPFRDPVTGKYYVITRIWKNGVRVSAICESRDFIHWSEPEEILRGNGFEDQIYSMPVFRYGDLYLGLASVYHEGNTMAPNFDTVDVELEFATDLKHWDSAAPGQKLIARGKGAYPDGDFDCGCIYASAPVEIDGKLWVYYMGGNGRHTGFRETSLARGYLEKDRFAYYEAGDEESEALLTTSHFVIYGGTLSLLADIEEDGWVSVALGTKNGGVYEGYEADHCILKQGEDGYYHISFKDRKISDLAAKPVSMHIHFKKARIYAVRGDLEHTGLKY